MSAAMTITLVRPMGVRVVVLVLALRVVGAAIIVGAVGGFLLVGVWVVVGRVIRRVVLRRRGGRRGEREISGGVCPLRNWRGEEDIYVEPSECQVKCLMRCY